MWLWTRHDELNHHYTRYTARRFAELAGAAGLRVDETRYFFHWTAAAKLGTRLAELVTTGAPESPRVPTQPLNHVLYYLSRLEERVLGRVGVPFGSSLLVAGTRPVIPQERA
jgi:hypothetical protein